MAHRAFPALAEGVYAALATPRREDSIEPDTAALLDYLDIVVRAGVDGLALFGSTGEFVHFDVTERIRTLGLAIRRSRVPVLVNVSHSTLDGALILAEGAIDSGAAGLLAMPPYFYRYSDGEVFRFYLQFAELIDQRVPIYLYNAPAVTNPISGALAERLLSTRLFAGINDSSGDWELFQKLNEFREKQNFRLLSGNERIYARSRVSGACGIVSGVAAALPELMVAMDGALREGLQDRVQALDEELQRFLDWISRFPATLGIKQAASLRGWDQDRFAVPLDEADLADLDRFRAWFRDWLPAVLKKCS
jgi:dihydrodipicolinate synthase/N-acetylneuraminate lyase